jgi:predicted nucleotidyltransferase
MTPECLDAVARVARTHGLDLVALFGSRAKGRARPDSDADIVVRSRAGELDWKAFAEISEGLRAAFPGADIDLVDLRRADPLLLRQIFSAARPLYEEPGRFAEARLHAFHRYEDYRPFLRLERRAVRRALGLDAG